MDRDSVKERVQALLISAGSPDASSAVLDLLMSFAFPPSADRRELANEIHQFFNAGIVESTSVEELLDDVAQLTINDAIDTTEFFLNERRSILARRNLLEQGQDNPMPLQVDGDASREQANGSRQPGSSSSTITSVESARRSPIGLVGMENVMEGMRINSQDGAGESEESEETKYSVDNRTTSTG